MAKPDHKRFNTLIDSFPYAMSVAKIIAQLLETMPTNGRLKILQVDAFPALFTKNIFLAMRDLKLCSKVEFIIHESSKKDLALMQEKVSLDTSGICYKIVSDLDLRSLQANDQVLVIVNNFLSDKTTEQHCAMIQDLISCPQVAIVLGAEKISRKSSSSLETLGLSFWSCEVNNLYHYLLIRDESQLDLVKNLLENEFVKNNNTEKYLDLIRVLNRICCPQAVPAVKLVLDELLSIDGYSANNHFFLAKFYKILGYKQKSLDSYQRALVADYYGLIDTQLAIDQLQKM